MGRERETKGRGRGGVVAEEVLLHIHRGSHGPAGWVGALDEILDDHGFIDAHGAGQVQVSAYVGNPLFFAGPGRLLAVPSLPTAFQYCAQAGHWMCHLSLHLGGVEGGSRAGLRRSSQDW